MFSKAFLVRVPEAILHRKSLIKKITYILPSPFRNAFLCFFNDTPPEFCVSDDSAQIVLFEVTEVAFIDLGFHEVDIIFNVFVILFLEKILPLSPLFPFVCLLCQLVSVRVVPYIWFKKPSTTILLCILSANLSDGQYYESESLGEGSFFWIYLRAFLLLFWLTSSVRPNSLLAMHSNRCCIMQASYKLFLYSAATFA